MQGLDGDLTFSQEYVADESRPLNAEERALWAKARRKPGRPKVGRGVRVISVSVERGLEKFLRVARVQP